MKRKTFVENTIAIKWHVLTNAVNFLLVQIYLLTPQSIIFLEKLTGSRLVEKFIIFYGNQRFITAFTTVHHLSLS
jgi:hypothetical protein